MKKIYKIFICLIMLFGFGLASCSNGSANEVPTYNENVGGAEDTNNNVVVDTNRKVIYSAEYTINNENISSIKSDVNNKSTSLQGYVSSSEEYTTRAKVVYRIPTDKLNEFLDYIDSFEGVTSKKISSEDITSSYSEVEARIQVLEASRASYVSLLSAGNLSKSEIMQIKDKIDDIDAELIKITLQKDAYDSLLEYSTVTINYYVSAPEVKEPTFFDEYWDYVASFFTGIGKAFMYLLPIALVGGAIFSAIFFPIYIKNKKRKLNK